MKSLEEGVVAAMVITGEVLRDDRKEKKGKGTEETAKADAGMQRGERAQNEYAHPIGRGGTVAHGEDSGR
ncbi:unnamed protein product [Pleuronectes platessa]|uniref:Uncharacterized protein n=1 Tax=Pleuronectes platessa TaxID=8262 RepID=A0A9N7UNJ6_PLEPL|nr:unnamed protein product [Pleuronectes platessa]